MKKSLFVAAIAGLFAATSAMAATLEVRVVDASESATHNVSGSPDTVDVLIQARLDGGTPTSDGLAIIGMNLKATEVNGAVAPSLCDTSAFLVVAPAGMQSFDRKNTTGPGFTNDGLTNPSGSANLSGFSGTCDGAGGLLQIGGGQNTIGNTSGGAPYPVGAVVADVGNNTWTTIATGSIEVSISGSEEIQLDVDTVFANTIDNFAGGSPYAVSEVLNGDISVTGLTISAGVLCADTDVDCSGTTNAIDIGIVAAPANFLGNPPTCDRADVDGSGTANAIDIGIIAAPANFLVSTGPCVCNTSTPGAGGCPTP